MDATDRTARYEEARMTIQQQTDEILARTANARLIAAAPEMADELRKALETFADFERISRLLGKHALATAALVPQESIRTLLTRIDGDAK